MAGFVFFVGLALLATLVMIWIVLPMQIGSLRRRLDEIDSHLRNVQPSPVPAPPPTPPPASAPAGASAPAQGPAPVPISAPAPPRIPVLPAPVAPPVRVIPPSAPAPEPAPVLAAPMAPAAVAPSPAQPATPPSDTWEVVVGTNWLNKIGVVVFIIGVALLVGYSVMHVGAFGRVAIGFALSATMLGAGAALERREMYRNYAYGLVAGGWAGIYFTAYAMHAVEAARIVDSEIVGTAALLFVAAGMIGHSLKYRSETVTSLAYATAYATLLLTPLTSFSLVASIPLAVSLILVAQRFGWSAVSILGLASTYGLFALRTATFPEALDSSGVTPYVALTSYWILFEIADFAGQRSRRATSIQGAPLFLLNAIGFIGSALVVLPNDNPVALSRFTAFAGAAYLASAILRARILRPQPAGPDEAASTVFGTTHGALAFAASLVAWSIDLRFTGGRQTLAFLLEAQLLFAAGLALGDRQIRGIGTAVAALLTLHHLSIAWPASGVSDPSTLVTALVAVCWYANRELLRRRRTPVFGLESAYTWAALVMVGLVISRELDPANQGLAAFFVATILLEAGLRHAPEYRVHAYVAALVGARNLVSQFALQLSPTSTPDVWRVLPAAVVLAYNFAWRLTKHDEAERAGGENRVGAAAAACLGTFLLVVLEWRIVPHVGVGAAWTATAVALVSVGLWKQVAGLRWQAYVLAFVAAYPGVLPLAGRPLESRSETIAVGATIGLAYLVAYLGRQALRLRPTEPTRDDSEGAAVTLLPAVATAMLVLFEWRLLPAATVGFGWTATAALLATLGRWRNASDFTWQACGLFGLAGLRTLQLIIAPGSATPGDALWLAATVVLFYAASLTIALGRQTLSLASTLLLTLLLLDQVRPTLVTLTWGLEGAVLLAAGFAARERVLRLSGLGLLLLCVLKLFVFDLSELEALARIMSFVVLGLVLLAVSWTYTRFREQIRKLL